MRASIFSILISILTISQLMAQERDNAKENGIYATAGFVYSVTFTYERALSFKDQKTNLLRFMYGRYEEFYGDFGNIYCVQYNRLNNWKKNNHIEWGLGLVVESIGKLLPTDTGGVKVFPAGNVGYRLQTPGGFILRAGAGFPEAVYISFGGAFGKKK